MGMLNIEIDNDIHHDFKVKCTELRISMKDKIEELLSDFIKD